MCTYNINMCCLSFKYSPRIKNAVKGWFRQFLKHCFEPRASTTGCIIHSSPVCGWNRLTTPAMWGGFVIFLKKHHWRCWGFCLIIIATKTILQTLLRLLWLSKLGCILYHVLMTKWIRICLKTSAACDFPLLFCHLLHLYTLHSLLFKQKWPIHCLLNIAYVENNQAPGHWLLFKIGCCSFGDCCGGVHQCFSFLGNHASHLSTCLEGRARRQNSLNESSIILELCRMDIKCPRSFNASSHS